MTPPADPAVPGAGRPQPHGGPADGYVLEEGSIPVLRFPALGLPQVQAVVTTRTGGVSRGSFAALNLGLHVGDDPAAVLENRQRAAGLVGLDRADLVFCNQSHGNAVVRVGRADRGRGADRSDTAIASADALVTTDVGVGLVAMVADCVPIVLVDSARGVLAVVHAGWRGTVAGVTSAAVRAMVDAGAQVADILVGVGPAIPPEVYEVGPDVITAARAGLGPAADRAIRRLPDRRTTFDLWTANVDQLVTAGVPAANVVVADIPTGADTPFYSHRGEQPTGRFAVIARLR